MTLAEQLMLLALDPERGRIAAGVTPARLRRGIVAAIVADLVLGRRVGADASGETLRVLDALPDFNPLLDKAAPLLARPPVPVSIGDAMRRVETGIRGLNRRVLASLVGRDILHHHREAFLFHRYPVRSQQALAQAQEKLRSVHERETPEPSALALGAIADACGVAAVRLDTEERFRMRRRLAPAAGDERAEMKLIFRIAQLA